MGWKRERGRAGARGSPPISPNDLGQPGRGAGCSPDAGPRDEVGAPRGPESSPKEGSGLRVLGPGHGAGSAGRRALSAVLKLAARRGGTEGRGRCAGPDAGQAGPEPAGRPGPSPPHSAHLARRTAEAPGPLRSAWRSRDAEQPEVWGRARWAPGRGWLDGGCGMGYRRRWSGDGVAESVGAPTSLPAQSCDTAVATAEACARYRLYTPPRK